HLTHWAGSKVLAEADDRRRSGQLEFHDLLVLSRDLLNRSSETRATLHARYERLLLDEFQDTDPIQIELAVRIAGGRDANAPDWRDVVIPEGRLFVVGDAKQSIYRFRRASIATYLNTQEVLGERATLSTNFRSGPAVIGWVNGVFETLIQYEEDAQPAYEALIAHRPEDPALVGPPVTVLGAEEHGEINADGLRALESADVAGVVNKILDEGWTVFDEIKEEWRPARKADIAVLLPSRTSMPRLEEALDAAGVHFRAESMSLVYEAPEIRDLLITARAIADPSDALALVAALRSPLFACGDDDLWAWRFAGGRIDLFATSPSESLAAGPVGQSLDYLRGLHRAARWLTPSEVLARIVDDRRLLEIGLHLPRTRDTWRRVRYVVDQARAWTEVAHGGLRNYLAWVAHQAQEKSRVSEAILPETDVDAVRVMTVHAAKGLEFPIVIMSGMTTRTKRQFGVRLLWSEHNYTVSLNRDLQDPLFETLAAIDESMGFLERTRLLYVAATRARDHLVVSMHRSVNGAEEPSPAELIESAGGALLGNPAHFEAAGPPVLQVQRPDRAAPPPEFEAWLRTVAKAQANSRRTTTITASGLEGTDPAVVLHAPEPGTAKGARDLDLPPWSKGRYGSAVGRAVHAVLQSVDLQTGDGLEDGAQAQVLAEGIPEFYDVVVNLVRSALASDIVRRAADRENWREIYVGAPTDDGQVMEGIIDLLYREDDGSLVVVDYKTDVVSEQNLASKTAFYRPQLAAYRTMLLASVTGPIAEKLLFLHPAGCHIVDL
ncbi:UvrD-helicase domain-containing protein, partial [Nocardioides sp. GCM10030258]|uniref:UvrD-helicase domain-containing protein n=1 Tax=unclassified Nocardioides TaxID=2615069 RepID=UPI00361CD03A